MSKKNRSSYQGLIGELEPHQIFVFGSNPEGRHGRGAARLALDKFGAIWGQGRGLQGQSYGLITKNLRPDYVEPETKITYSKAGPRSISSNMLIVNIRELYSVARKKTDFQFLIAYQKGSKNLNGYSDIEMAEMFKKAQPIPKNIIFEKGFHQLVFTSKIKE